MSRAPIKVGGGLRPRDSALVSVPAFANFRSMCRLCGRRSPVSVCGACWRWSALIARVESTPAWHRGRSARVRSGRGG